MASQVFLRKQRLNMPLGLVAGISVIFGQLLAMRFRISPPTFTSAYMILALALIALGAAGALIGYVLWLALWEREPNPGLRLRAIARRTPAYLAHKIWPLFLVFLFLGAFGTFKLMIPRIHPFALDGALSDIDRLIFGTDPWRLTHAVIGPVGTRWIDLIYDLWFPAWVGALVYFCLFAEEDKRRRFLLAFVGIWAILGIILATILSSAGPCFLQMIGHPYAVRYTGLFQDAPVATQTQALLATTYRTNNGNLALGISAMPSIHVAIAALLMFSARRAALIVAAIFYALIFLGSVHLGWHYFSDGLVGTAGAWVIWKLCDREIRRGLYARTDKLPALG